MLFPWERKNEIEKAIDVRNEETEIDIEKSFDVEKEPEYEKGD